MRQVNIKNLYKNLSKEFDDLPFEVTKRGKVVACVTQIGLDNKEPGLDSLSQCMDKSGARSDHLKQKIEPSDHLDKKRSDHLNKIKNDIDSMVNKNVKEFPAPKNCIKGIDPDAGDRIRKRFNIKSQNLDNIKQEQNNILRDYSKSKQLGKKK